MRSMDSYWKAAMERAMKIQEVILRAMARKITWFQAAEILGFSDRHLRRMRERYQEFGYDGLFDRRRGKPSPKRVPLATVEAVLGLYREKYFDLNVRHFHEKLQGEHQIDLSYSWVKAALQGAGLVARRALVRPDRDFGRCQQRDLLRAAGGRGIELDGDGRTERSDREKRGVLRVIQRSRQSFLAHSQGGRQDRSPPADASV